MCLTIGGSSHVVAPKSGRVWEFVREVHRRCEVLSAGSHFEPTGMRFTSHRFRCHHSSTTGGIGAVTAVRFLCYIPPPDLLTEHPMRRVWPRLLKSVLPITLLCGAAGYLYAVAAGAYIADEREDGSTLRGALAWRVPFAMAFWGGGFTLLVEWFRHLWGANTKDDKKAEAAPAPTPEQAAEQLLLQLLEQAEAAERSRAMPMPELRPAPTPGELPTFPPVPTQSVGS
jgi:hypothetical protein